MTHAVSTSRRTTSSATGLGERLRHLRAAAGMTQTDLAGDRFSKEYVSQIERGKTRPTRETIEWLAQQLRVDADFLQNGISTDERSRIETMLARAEALAEAHKCEQALEQIEDTRTAVLVTGAPELAEGPEDKRMTAHVYFQASLIAEREGHWVTARNYAERARSLYADVEDQADVGRLLNNLGGLSYLLHKPDDALRYLKDAFKVLIDIGRDEEAATAVSSLAQVHLGTGELTTAEEQARHALTLMGGREDRLDEIGNARRVLGRSLLEQGRLDEAETAFDEAENTFERF